MAIMKKDMDFFIQTRDVDYNDVIKPTAILDFCQDLAGLHAAEIGVGYETMKKRNYAWVVLYQHYEIIKIPPYLDYTKLSTWPKPKGRLEFEREYLMTDKQDNVLMRGISNWVVIDLTTRSLVRADKVDFIGEYFDFTNYPEKCKRRINLDPSKITDWYEYSVEYDDLDHNGHMNNAKYMTAIINFYSLYGTKKYFKEAECAYIKEAKYGDTIKMGHYTIDEKEAFMVFINDELCFESLIGVEEK